MLKGFRSALFLIACLGATAPAFAARGRHPHFDDGGVLAWHTGLRDAQREACADGKVIFLEYGRRRCAQCRTLVSKVLPDSSVAPRMSKVAVGLAADCDDPEPEVEALLRRNLPASATLPLVGFVLPDGRWLCGFGGAIDARRFLEHVAAAERWVAAEAAARRSAPCLARARSAAARGAWCEVVRLCREHGTREPEMASLRRDARTWVEDRLAEAVSLLGAGRYDQAVAECAAVERAMQGEPEGAEARMGARAAALLKAIAAVPASDADADALRARAAQELRGTRWAALVAPPSDPPAGAAG
jgi:hypothetical protein